MTVRKPSGWLYVVGIVVFFGSCAGSFSHPLLSSSGNVESMPRFVMPGKHEVSLEAGSHYLYAETRSIVDGQKLMWNGGTFRCSLTERDTRASVALVAASMNESYSLGSYSGESAFDLDIVSPGMYVLACEVDNGPMVVALSHGRVLGSMMWILGFWMLGCLAGSIIIAYTAWYRARAARSSTDAPAGA